MRHGSPRSGAAIAHIALIQAQAAACCDDPKFWMILLSALVAIRDGKPWPQLLDGSR